ncbi:hypothetical protein BC332_05361 [Capsicum chinense]|nr:hypothetical protein BC332_05361 [Capsicum chinense]
MFVSGIEELSKRLLQLKDIPLKVSTVQALDSAVRLTSVFPPMPHPLAHEKGVDIKPRKPLEGSGNWPMDEIAIEKTKTAFLLRIAESLQNNWGMMFSATEDDVDVLMSGYAFRLKISHERALSLVTGQSNNSRHQWSLSADRQLLLRHQHASKINALRGRYPIYGPIVRLAKRWVSAHLFSTVLTEETVELLVSNLFLRPLPFEPPFSRITGFLREEGRGLKVRIWVKPRLAVVLILSRFLRLLSEYDWAFSPLIVDFDGEFSTEEKNKINENFMRSREEHEKDTQKLSPAMFLATKYDIASEAWTRSSPTTAELRRLVAYSTGSANLLTKLILQDGYDSYGWKCLLRTPLSNYDAVVLLHRDKLPYPQHLLFPSELEQERCAVRGHATKIFHPFFSPGDFKVNSGELKSKLMVNFDPKGFSDEVKVWYDAVGGDALGLTLGKASSKNPFIISNESSIVNGSGSLFLLCRSSVELGDRDGSAQNSIGYQMYSKAWNWSLGLLLCWLQGLSTVEPQPPNLPFNLRNSLGSQVEIVQLTASGNFEEALALCKLLPPEDPSLRSAKEKSIHTRYTRFLFENGSYEEAMEHFVASQVEITYVLALYPSIVVPKSSCIPEPQKFADVADAPYLSRGSSGLSDDLDFAPSDFLESDEMAIESKKMSHSTLIALIKYFQKKRYSVFEKATTEGTEEVVSDAVGDNFTSYGTGRSKKPTKDRIHIHITSIARDMAAILDTALLQTLLLTGQPSAATDFLKALNYCDVKICEEFLQKRSQYACQLELYRYNSIHYEALKLLHQLVEQSKSEQTPVELSTKFKPDMIIEYLKPLCATDPMLVLEFSLPILESCPTETIKLFLSGNIQADLVNSYLKQHAPDMQATYLERMLTMNENSISEDL